MERILTKQPILEIGKQNSEGRIYTKKAVDEILAKFETGDVVYGELGHPESEYITINNISHKITSMYVEDNILYLDAELTETPAGWAAAELPNIKFGIRGIVNPPLQDGIVDSIELITCDIIQN
jgi:hypothetical protein